MYEDLLRERFAPVEPEPVDEATAVAEVLRMAEVDDDIGHSGEASERCCAPHSDCQWCDKSLTSPDRMRSTTSRVNGGAE